MRFAKNSAILINPIQFPRGTRGRPGEKKYRKLSEQVFEFGRGRPRQPKTWKVDIFSSSGMIDSLIGQGTAETAKAEAQGMIGKKFKGQKVVKVVLDGPFDSIDDISVHDEEIPEFAPRTPDEIEVMELASRLPSRKKGLKTIRRGTTQAGHEIIDYDFDDDSDDLFRDYSREKKRGRPRKHPVQSETHKYKIGQVVLVKTSEKTPYKYGIITRQLTYNANYSTPKYNLNIFYEGTGISSSSIIHQERIIPLPKGRPSAYVKGIIDALRKTV
jgi:hypothetical protein